MSIEDERTAKTSSAGDLRETDVGRIVRREKQSKRKVLRPRVPLTVEGGGAWSQMRLVMHHLTKDEMEWK